jgi:two-component system sensor histidine kinase KdpD
MKPKKILKGILISVLLLGIATALSTQFQKWGVQELITTIFVFAVFLISLFTDGFIYGVVSSVVGMFLINFVFTYPYFELNFIKPRNLISAVIMLAVAVITGVLVTKIKRHEAIKAENERERMRANLLRAVSHDLRTPLTTIYSASTMLKENSEALNKQQRTQMLGSIQEEAQWLVRMVENLLLVTRIDNSTIKINKTPIILDELIDSVVTKFSAQHPSQKINLLLPEEIVIIPMDSILIEQVIRNLLENAVFHAKGMTMITLKVYTEGDRAVFEVSDDGAGIEEGKLKKIFTGNYGDRKDTGRREKRFAGIGLSVCATIIKAHGGTITAQNLETGGALFKFTLEKENSPDDE